MWGRPLSPLTMQVALMPLNLVSTQAPLISHSTRSTKLLFFQKPAAVVVIVDLVCIQDYEERREGVYAQDELSIQANTPSPLLPRSSVQNGRPYFWELTVHAVVT